MKTTTILGSLALALPAFAAPAPAATGSRSSGTCPSNNKALLTSNNNVNYSVLCSSDLSTDVIRTTDTEVGIQGCLTACDGTVGCTAVTFVASSKDQKTGKCYSRKNGKTRSAGSNTAVAILVSPEPTSTIPWPTSTATTHTVSTASASSATATPSSVASTIFGGLSLRSGSNIQYGAINAHANNFYIGKDTTTYCPAVANPCPVQTNTIFATNNNTLGLDTVVPGGQQVYVNATGALQFTTAHSGYTGVNSTTTGFKINQYGHLQFYGNDWLACPVDTQAYQIYAASAATGFDTSACLGFGFMVETFKPAPVAAWQYV